jgi:hypothetical protein
MHPSKQISPYHLSTHFLDLTEKCKKKDAELSMDPEGLLTAEDAE